MNYYPYVSGGPAEAGHLTLLGCDVVLYVNSRYLDLDENSLNPRATALFEMAGVGIAAGFAATRSWCGLPLCVRLR